MYDKAADTPPLIIKCVPECNKTQESCYKTFHRFLFVFDSIPDQYKSQEICDVAVCLYSLSIVYCPNK